MRLGRRVVLLALLATSTLRCAPAPPAPRGVVHLLPLLQAAGAKAARVSHQSVAMEALVQQAGGADSLSVRVPERGRLFLWVASDADTDRTFRVTRRARGRAKVLHEGQARRTWERIDVDLASLAGREIQLGFHAEGPARSVFHWGAPVVAGPDSARLDLVLWVVDTLRRDALDVYGSPGRIAPEMSRFAREGTLFADCLSTTSWTRPAMASIMTSRSALGHGVVAEDRKLPRELKTLAETLNEAGWCTVAIVTNPNAGAAAGLDRGFDVVVDHFGLYQHFHRHASPEERRSIPSSSSPSVTSELAFRYLQDWLPSVPDMPLFLYVHVNDPHAPNDAREPFGRMPGMRMESLKTPGMPRSSERYGACVRAADWFFGRSLRLFSEHGLDRSLIALTADHGEEFKEHGSRGHGMNLHAETVRVPFALRCPGPVPGGRLVTERTSLLDLAPTILDLLKLPPDEGHEGSSLQPLLRGTPTAAGERSFYLHVFEQQTRLDRAAVADSSLVGELGLVRGQRKFLERDYGDRGIAAATLLFDTEADPGELTNLAGASASVADSFAVASFRWRERERRSGARAEETAVDAATRAQLEALGYLK